ncbi:MAG: hypothetical protein Q4F49_03635 [Pseudoxanthomonas suwonensis]|nr:hypothetical protein [Pseudoxanthomonas suwonensis]
MRAFVLMSCCLVLLAGCSSLPTEGRGWIEPAAAVRAANEQPESGIDGTFVMTVRAIGHERGKTYLNSETDFRSQICLTVAVPDEVMAQVEKRLGLQSGGLGGRRILVDGHAKRVPIDYLRDGVPTGLFYYQTHVRVLDPAQVRLAD